ncbi:hypothetical protein ACLVWU_08610 [Bdellovibrio sp. HCB290]|uniref:hypothetical protein n=1 Tax=Bdellovibrio sp. HCB290 TaxID=3394356 RepID=UPI0039B470F2
MKFVVLLCLLLTACSEEIFQQKDEPKIEAKTRQYDLIWDNEFELKENTVVRVPRLIITSNAKIRTHDKSLIIVVDELISESGTIENFKDGDSASLEKSGLSGGSISINAKYAEGRLSIDLRGQNGGRGKHGAITMPGRHPGCAGTNGGNGGNSGSLYVDYDNGSLQIATTNTPGLKGERGVRGAAPKFESEETSIQPPCIADAKDGVDGVPGIKGLVCISGKCE